MMRAPLVPACGDETDVHLLAKVLVRLGVGHGVDDNYAGAR